MEQKWIYTSDKYPNPGERVLLAIINGEWDTRPNVHVGVRWVHRYNVDGYEEGVEYKRVVAWMPLPESPKPLNWGENKHEG